MHSSWHVQSKTSLKTSCLICSLNLMASENKLTIYLVHLFFNRIPFCIFKLLITTFGTIVINTSFHTVLEKLTSITGWRMNITKTKTNNKNTNEDARFSIHFVTYRLYYLHIRCVWKTTKQSKFEIIEFCAKWQKTNTWNENFEHEPLELVYKWNLYLRDLLWLELCCQV